MRQLFDQLGEYLSRSLNHTKAQRVHREVTVDNLVEHVLNRPSKVAALLRPRHSPTTFQGVEGSAHVR